MDKPRVRVTTAGEVRVTDGLVNLVANMGTERDKATGASYVRSAQTGADYFAAYSESALVRRAVDLPAEDAVREWRSWQGTAEEIEKLEAEEKRLGLRAKVYEARRLARLFGGAAIYIGDEVTTPEQARKPLDPERIKAGGIRYLSILSSTALSPGEVDRDLSSPLFGRPGLWNISSGGTAQVEVHPSRLVFFHGVTPLLDGHGVYAPLGWGDSVLHGMLPALRRVEELASNANSLVYEAKVDVIRIKGLMANMQARGDAWTSEILRRLTLAATGKGINGTLILDSEEEYDQKSASFGGIPELLDRAMHLASAATGIPVSLLFGRAAAGLNATGEMEVRSYYDRVRVEQEMHMTGAMAVLDECLVRSALGSRPPEVFATWNPLWSPDASEVATIGKTLAETLKIARDMNAVSDEAIGLALVNALTESGAFPGLEGYAEEFPLVEADEGEDGTMPDVETEADE